MPDLQAIKSITPTLIFTGESLGVRDGAREGALPLGLLSATTSRGITGCLRDAAALCFTWLRVGLCVSLSS